MRNDPTDSQLDAHLRGLPAENWDALAGAVAELEQQTTFSREASGHFEAVGALADLYTLPSKLGMSVPYDWPAWTWGNDFLRRCDPGEVAGVPAEGCVRLITLLIRKERFAEGTWIGSAETGMLQALLRRVLETYHPAG